MTARKPTNKSTSRTAGSRRRTKTASKAPKTIDLQAEDVTDRDDERVEEAANAEVETKAAETASSVDADDAHLDPATPAKEEARTEEDREDKPAADTEPSGDADDARVEDEKAAAEDESKTSDAGQNIDGKAEGDKVDQSETVKSEEPSVAAAPVTASQPVAKGGFGSGLIGGLLGGVAIVAASYVGLQQGAISLPGMDAQKSEQASQLAEVKSALSGLEGKVGQAADIDLSPLQSRLAALEEQIKTLSTPAAPAPDGGSQETVAQGQEGNGATETNSAPSAQEVAFYKDALDALSQSVSEQVSKLDGLSQRLEGLESLNAQFVQAREQLAALETKASEQAALIEQKAAEQATALAEKLKEAEGSILSSADRRIDNLVTDLTNLGSQLGDSAKSLTDRVSSLEENNLSEKMQSSAQTIALAGLENAVASGASYQLALDTFAKVAADHPALEGLKAHASSGAPTKSALASSFNKIYDAVLREAEDAGAATLLDKFLLNAQNLVRVRSLSGEKKGESLTNKLGVIDFHIRQGDLTKAAEEWDALPAQARDAKSGADWVKGLKARIAVNAAMDAIRADFGKSANATAQ